MHPQTWRDILATMSAERSPFLPNVTTLKENGIDLVADSWYGMWLPAGSPPEFAKRLSEAIVAVLAKEARPGDVILGMSNGGFGGFHDKLLKALAAR